jgi:hypothetical protein
MAQHQKIAVIGQPWEFQCEKPVPSPELASSDWSKLPIMQLINQFVFLSVIVQAGWHHRVIQNFSCCICEH